MICSQGYLKKKRSFKQFVKTQKIIPNIGLQKRGSTDRIYPFGSVLLWYCVLLSSGILFCLRNSCTIRRASASSSGDIEMLWFCDSICLRCSSRILNRLCTSAPRFLRMSIWAPISPTTLSSIWKQKRQLCNTKKSIF